MGWETELRMKRERGKKQRPNRNGGMMEKSRRGFEGREKKKKTWEQKNEGREERKAERGATHSHVHLVPQIID